MVNKLIEECRIKKIELVKNQDFEKAAIWREIERFLYKVQSDEKNIFDFVNFLKSNVIYNDAYETFKYLDVKGQRKEKIKKLQLKNNFI
jgi:hypothetical protein